jgi:putative selenate reductase
MLNSTLGYEDIAVSPKAFKPHLTFVQTIKITKSMYEVARNLGRTLGLKFINPLMVENRKGYFDTELMYLSGPPLHVFALQIVKKFREALGNIHSHIPMAFSAGVDDKNFADVVSANLAPVTVCTDILKPPGFTKLSGYLKELGEKMQAVEAINVPDYVMKRFGHEMDGVHDVFAKLRKEVRNLGQRLPEEEREETVRTQLQTFNQLELRVLNAMEENSDSLELLTTDALIITDTLKACHQKFGGSVLMPPTFKELYREIISAVAIRNLETLFDQIIHNDRYTFARNSAVPQKEETELGLYDCISCGNCITICPSNANFVYHVSPSKITYVNYELTEDGLKEIEGGQFVIEKAYQIANFDDCCNECSVCAIHCPERGEPYTAKPKYFGRREDWEAYKDCDGFFVEKKDTVATIVGRIDGKEYTLSHDTESIQAIFSDGVIQGVFEYPEGTLIDKDILDPKQIGHILDLKIYHLLITQLEGVLNDEDCNYINIKYV